MKNFLLASLLVFSSLLLRGQTFFSLGANYSTQSTAGTFPFGKQKPETFKLSPTIGFGHTFRINEKWSYQPGLYFGDFGSINNPDNPGSSFYAYSASLNQFIEYKPLPWLSIGISPTISYIGFAGRKTRFDGKSHYTDWEDTGGELNRLVFSVVPRISFHLNKRWSLDLQYKYDLNSSMSLHIPEPYNFDLKWKSYGIGLNLRYEFRGKK